MPVTVVIGAQWGDEGKGRFVDWFAASAQMVGRYAGGDNAGHTVAVGDTVYKLHLIPSGVLRDGTVAVMGNGMVVNPVSLLAEMDTLAAQGVSITPDNLLISSRAHVITPAHRALDKARELARGKDAIGTTLRGIGPAYLDKFARRGIRMGQMLDVETFAELVTQALQQATPELVEAGLDPLDVAEHVNTYVAAANRLKPFIKDTAMYMNQRLQAGASMVCEGAQGALLDVDHGSYPFVTSSSPTIGGALTGLGIGATSIERVVGVAKAFSTRVGSGPMPTELEGEIADRLRGTGEQFWDEYGTTTGRPRRCGWLDAVLLRYSCLVNGFTELCLTKLDILSGFDELKIAVAYDIDGERVTLPPETAEGLSQVTPIYETLPGWQDDVSGARTPDDLPAAARAYIERIGDLVGLPVHLVSVGPERTQLVDMR